MKVGYRLFAATAFHIHSLFKLWGIHILLRFSLFVLQWRRRNVSFPPAVSPIVPFPIKMTLTDDVEGFVWDSCIDLYSSVSNTVITSRNLIFMRFLRWVLTESYVHSRHGYSWLPVGTIWPRWWSAIWYCAHETSYNILSIVRLGWKCDRKIVPYAVCSQVSQPYAKSWSTEKQILRMTSITLEILLA